MNIDKAAENVSKIIGLSKEQIKHDYLAFFKGIRAEFADRDLRSECTEEEFEPIKISLSSFGKFYCGYRDKIKTINRLNSGKQNGTSKDQTNI